MGARVNGTPVPDVVASPTGSVQGDVLYYSGSAWSRLAAGTNGYFLKTQGAAANPTWAAVDLTSYAALAGAAFTGDVSLATTKKLRGVAELNLNAPTSSAINLQVNDVTKLKVASNGGVCIGTMDAAANNPATGKLLLSYGSVLSFEDAAGTVRDVMTYTGNTLNISSAYHILISTGAGAVGYFQVAGATTASYSNTQFITALGRKIKRTAVSDAAYTVLITDEIVAYSTLTATRVVTLPSAVTVGAGALFTIKDESGNCAAGVKLTITPAGGQTIDGAATLDLIVAYKSQDIYSNGANWFTR